MSIPTVTPPTPATVPPPVTVGFHERRRAGTKPVALVTAPLRGPALDELREHADVVLDPWIDQLPLRLYDAEQLAARIAELGATIVICEADTLLGPGARPAARRHRLDPGRPHQRRPRRRHRQGHPRAARPGPQRRRRGRA